MIPPLLGAFSCFVWLFNSEMELGLAMCYVHFCRSFIAPDDKATLILTAVASLAVFVPLSLLSAKGKIWTYYIGMGLYIADFVFFFFEANVTPGSAIFQVGSHVVFLIVYVLGLVYYYKARKLLYDNPEAINRDE